MPQLLITINYEVPDTVDAEATPIRRRRDVDLLAELTLAQQTAVAGMMTRIVNAVTARYGTDTVIEGMRFVPDQEGA